MAADDEAPGTDERIRRSVGRSLLNWTVVGVSLLILGGWASTGIYELAPGEEAVILQFGARNRTVAKPGLKWHWPEPIERLKIVNATAIRDRAFGLRVEAPRLPGENTPADTETPEAGHGRPAFQNAMQTADSNIVNLGYVLQYRIDDAFTYLYAVADPSDTLFDITRAAVREVVGHMTVDEVLSTRRSEIEDEARKILRKRLTDYFSVYDAGSPFDVLAVRLQVVQPPAQVQEAFYDVVSARQDEERAASEALGDAKEILERAKAEAIEVEQASLAYKESKVLEARGRSARFEALLTEYQRAPEVTRRRLYLETMEEVFPRMEKMIIEPGSASMIPYFPMQGGGSRRPVAAPPSSPPEPAKTAPPAREPAR